MSKRLHSAVCKFQPVPLDGGWRWGVCVGGGGGVGNNLFAGGWETNIFFSLGLKEKQILWNIYLLFYYFLPNIQKQTFFLFLRPTIFFLTSPHPKKIK